MSELFLGLSPEYLYFQGKKPEPIQGFHQPYFLAFSSKEMSTENTRKKFISNWQKNRDSHSILEKIVDVGELETYNSFSDFSCTRDVFKVFTKHSYLVPEISDYLFFEHGLFTAEHDIPYQQRVLVDLEGDKKTWLFDTEGKKKRLSVFVYDIEISQWDAGKKNLPIDIIGHAQFHIDFDSEKNLDTEQFRFDIMDCPSHWQDIEVKQFLANTVDDEVDNLLQLCLLIKKHDIITGHNIVGFDNYQLLGRIDHIMKHNLGNLSSDEKKVFQQFTQVQSRLDKSFHFGVGSEVVQIYPCSFDTYLAARKFYSFLDDFGLKTLAPFLDIHVPDRIYLTPGQIKRDDRTLKYNKQDIQEQIGVTLNMIQQALPLAFTTGMPFDMLLPAGAVNMWDHMALIRGRTKRKIMPPICRVFSIAQILLHHFPGCSSREELVRTAKQKREQLSKDIIRILKYGEEMPEWVLYPYVIFNERATDDDRLGYHMPGGMTIKPDKDVMSHFIPWYHVVVADVGAMYPTILKAMNIGADTVRLARKGETPDEWIWLKKLPEQFFKDIDCVWRKISAKESFADQGYMLGIKIDEKPGVVNLGMTGVMSTIAILKKELKESKRRGDVREIQRLKMMYQSMKGARNAGTHGVLAAPLVTGRQFNVWGAAAITTKGQMILSDTLDTLKNKGIRVVYGDTDGIYLGCSRSMGNIPRFAKAVSTSVINDETTWLTKPEVAFAAIDYCDRKWQEKLQYPDFELEPEVHDAMIFVKHKNYLIFDEKDGKVNLVTKGNNFKGSDKANIARKVLEEIMMLVLKDNPCWESEETVRESVRTSIKVNTKLALENLKLNEVDIDDLTLIQSVQPARRYKTNQDGSASTFGKRAAALEALLDERIRTRVKLKFVVTKKPLPGIANPSKSGVKPIDFMYPIDLLKDVKEIDLEWYKKMIENFIDGAFGLSAVSATEQTGLDAWM